jgi:leader peptidase (prepilin peptidase)/N-methyltransferase
MANALMMLAIASVIGSFLGVLVRRLAVGEDIVWRRSHCETCGYTLAVRDLVPIFSFVACRGACRQCSVAIPVEHLAIELAAVAVAAWAWTVDAGAALWWDCVLGWTLLALAWIDLRYFRLPDVLTLPLLLVGLVATGLEASASLPEALPVALTDHAIAAASGYLCFRGVGFAYRLLRNREGMGQGDAKLLAAGGAWLGFGLLPVTIFLAALLGLGQALISAARNGRLSGASVIPFGPALALAIWLLWLYGRPASDLAIP